MYLPALGSGYLKQPTERIYGFANGYYGFTNGYYGFTNGYYF